jgi:IS5 family transposase
MRQRFEQQITLGTVAIADVQLPLKSRDELPPTLAALQYIFVTAELNNKVFTLLEEKICAKKKKTGRTGMDLWHILVLAVVRHATNTNWDTLEGLANYHALIRQVMGVHNLGFSGQECIAFKYQTILDNVSLIDEELLYEINQLVVEAGQKLLKKKEDEGLRLKTDSFVVETNVHFPTDINLLWDSTRKGLDMVELLNGLVQVPGWRKVKSIRRDFKSLFRYTSQIVFRGKDEKKKKEAVKAYLNLALGLKERCQAIIQDPPVAQGSTEQIASIIIELTRYCEYMGKFCDQIERRLIKGEAIPAEEKVFSIFEPHTEWITKGKHNKKVELGLLMMITTDQRQFIVDYKVMEKQRDQAQVAPLLKRLDKNFPGIRITSHSFDKGYHNKDNQKTLDESGIERPILPKKGRHNQEDKARESDPEFKRLRRAHSAVESNINMLEHHGLNRCMDKGLRGFRRYVGLSVLAYNMHQLGNALLAAERKEEERIQKHLLKRAA